MLIAGLPNEYKCWFFFGECKSHSLVFGFKLSSSYFSYLNYHKCSNVCFLKHSYNLVRGKICGKTNMFLFYFILLALHYFYFLTNIYKQTNLTFLMIAICFTMQWTLARARQNWTFFDDIGYCSAWSQSKSKAKGLVWTKGEH